MPSFDFKIPDDKNKRRAQSTSTESSNINDTVQASKITDKYKNNDKEKNTNTKPPKKKAKKEESPTDLEQKLEAAKRYFENKSITPTVNFDSLSKFLTESFGNRDTINLAIKYSPDLTQLAETLRLSYDHITDNALRSRIKRILKKLDNQDDYTSSSGTSTQEE